MIATLHRQLDCVVKHGLVLKKSAKTQSNVALTIRSSDHPGAHDMSDKILINMLSSNIFQIRSPVLNRFVDRGPCLELKINAGRSTQSLLRSLRAWDRLG